MTQFVPCRDALLRRCPSVRRCRRGFAFEMPAGEIGTVVGDRLIVRLTGGGLFVADFRHRGVAQTVVAYAQLHVGQIVVAVWGRKTTGVPACAVRCQIIPENGLFKPLLLEKVGARRTADLCPGGIPLQTLQQRG